MKRVLQILIFPTFFVLNILFLINNSLDSQYWIEPFEEGDDILELKRIVHQKIRDANFAIIMNLVLFLVYAILNWLPNRK